jgi:apolipoprotein N-acyltransferase
VQIKALRVLGLVSVLKLSWHSRIFEKIILAFKSRSRELLNIFVIDFFFISVSALLMYYAKHQTGPEIFENAFSEFWWAFTALTTVGFWRRVPHNYDWQDTKSVLILSLGIALLAVPTTLTASAILKQSKKKYCTHCGKKL